MSKFTHYITVGLAEAAHLLHEVHSPKEFVLGLSEDVLRALATGTMEAIPEPPASSAPPPVVAPPTSDPRVDALVTSVAAQQAQLAQLLAGLAPLLAQATAPTAVPVQTPVPVVMAKPP